MVVKSDHRRQEWNPDKLRRSLQVACTKRPISAETIERTVEQIEAELRSRDTTEVPSSVVGDLVMEKLRQLDQVAYIRFASVYRAFADISSFEDEVRRLIERASLNGSAGTPSPGVMATARDSALNAWVPEAAPSGTAASAAMLAPRSGSGSARTSAGSSSSSGRRSHSVSGASGAASGQRAAQEQAAGKDPSVAGSRGAARRTNNNTAQPPDPSATTNIPPGAAGMR